MRNKNSLLPSMRSAIRLRLLGTMCSCYVLALVVVIVCVCVCVCVSAHTRSQEREDAIQNFKDKFAAWKQMYDAADAEGKRALLESGKMQLKVRCLSAFFYFLL
jgi:hypothetical protein